MKYLAILNIVLSLFFVGSCKGDDWRPTDNEDTEVSANDSFQFSFEDKTYTIFLVNLDWVAAAAYSSNLGGYLTEINSQAEQDTIFQVLTTFYNHYDNTIAPDGGDFPHFWIGANDFSEEGVWIWDGNNDGAEVVQFWQGTQMGTIVNGLYNNWGFEPSNGAGGQHAMGIVPVDWTNGAAGTWNDVKETNELFFIVEFDE